MQTNFEVVSYIANGFIRRFKVSKNNPRDFKAGDWFIVVGQSTKAERVNDINAAQKLNESIITADKIRKFME